MALSRRLNDLDKNLELLYEQLGSLERSLVMAYDARKEVSIRQEIREIIKPQIHQYEIEYWHLLAQEVNSFSLDEADASNAILEVVQVVDLVENDAANHYPQEIIELLIEIRNKLTEPDKPAAAKLKAAIPLLPPFVSYEVEWETKGILQRMFPTFSRVFRRAEKK